MSEEDPYTISERNRAAMPHVDSPWTVLAKVLFAILTLLMGLLGVLCSLCGLIVLPTASGKFALVPFLFILFGAALIWGAVALFRVLFFKRRRAKGE